jgi:hypothetical protein
LLRSFVEQGLEASERGADGSPRRAADLPLAADQLSNAGLFALLEK